MLCCQCFIYISVEHLLIDPPLVVDFNFINLCVFQYYVLLHDYYLCFNGFPFYTVGYYNYKYVWPYPVVIHIM